MPPTPKASFTATSSPLIFSSPNPVTPHSKTPQKPVNLRPHPAAVLPAHPQRLKRHPDSGRIAPPPPVSSVGAQHAAPYPEAASAVAQTSSAPSPPPPQSSATKVATPSSAQVAQVKKPLARNWKFLLPTAALLLAIASGALYWRSTKAHALTERDSLVLTDFINTTGDQIFDRTLKQALEVDLRQSPFLNIVSEQKVRATLKLMGRSQDERLTIEVARDLAQRTSSKAVLAGDIAQLGSQYVITLNAINAVNGDTIAEDQEQAESKETALAALGKAASRLRGELGESLASIHNLDKPLEEATTSSLDALRALSHAEETRYTRGDDEAIPFYQHAVELDPNFALAYAKLGTIYGNNRERSREIAHITKAYESA